MNNLTHITHFVIFFRHIMVKNMEEQSTTIQFIVGNLFSKLKFISTHKLKLNVPSTEIPNRTGDSNCCGSLQFCQYVPCLAEGKARHMGPRENSINYSLLNYVKN
jgi:hypothetical protein